MIALSFLWCMAVGNCQTVHDPTRYNTPMACMIASQQVAASYLNQHGGFINPRTLRCGRPERSA